MMPRVRRWRAAKAAVCLLGLAVVAAEAQRPGGLQPEARLDVLASRRTALHAGVGVSAAVERYVRLELLAAAGASWRRGGAVGSARVDGVARFMLDPEFAAPWAPYAGGGIGARWDAGDGWRGVFIALLGVEGPRWGSVVPFVEIGYGGGARVGAGLRKALQGRR